MTWSEIWSNSQSTEIVDMEWIEYSYDISKIADGQQTVFIKWDYCIKMDGLKLAWAYSGWNIDDVVISGVAPCAADIDGNGDVGVGDVLSIIEQWGLTNSPADLNNDGIVNVSDLLVVVGNWGPCN